MTGTRHHSPLCAWQPASRARQQGLTLVELMIALTIGLIIMAVVGQIFLSSRATFKLEEGLARSQEGGRFAMEFLAVDIRMAGYAGCNGKLTVGTVTGGNCPSGTVCSIAQPANLLTTFNPEGLRAHRYTGSGGTALGDWTPALPGDYFAAGEVRPYTDVITIQHGSTNFTHLTGNTTPSNANVQIVETAAVASELQADDILLLSDCKNGDVFRANNVSSGSGKITIAHSSATNTQNTLTHSYGNDAELMKLISRAYYIGTGASGEPALFRKELTTGGVAGTAEELVEGVEIMRLLFGEDTDATADGVANIYRAANSVADWKKVVSVRVGLLLRTPNNVEEALDVKTYEIVDGVTYDPADDRRRRQLYRSTIQVRNSIP